MAIEAIVKDQGLAPALAEFHRVFDAVNEKFFKGDLPSPIITIQSNGRMVNALGWCTSWRAWQTAKAEAEAEGDEEGGTLDGRFEINLSAEYMNRPTNDLMETLVHEVAHYANAHQGTKDCSGSQYHNKHFKAMAEYLWLHVEKTPKHGWARTAPTPELLEFFGELKIDDTVFEFARTGTVTKPKAATKMKLWECRCGTKIRAAVEIDATCNKCNRPFEKQE